MERRVDHGQAYTKEEFVKFYGGTKEWDNARPAPASATDPSAEAAAETTGKGRMSAKEAFAKFDTDDDGSLTFDEMVSAMRAMGITMDKDKLKVVFDEYDSDHSETIDYPEFVLLMNTGKEDDEASEEDELRTAFNDCDKNGNKQLELDELKDIMTEFGVDMPDEEVREMFAEADTDRSGSISFDEFKKLMLTK